MSEGIGTLEIAPIDMLSALRHHRQRREADAARADQGRSSTRTASRSGRCPTTSPRRTEVVSKQAAYIVTDILAGNTDPKINPYWGEWAIYDSGIRRPAAYKTGTTSDNIDVHAYGFLAPPKDKKAPALAVGVWMGNSNNDPNQGSLSLDSSAPLWSAIMTAVSKDMPIASFKAPERAQDRHGRRVHRAQAGTVHDQDGPRAVPAGHRAEAARRPIRVALEVDAASRSAVAGRLRRAEGHPRLLRPLRGRGELPVLAEGGPQLGAPVRPRGRACAADRKGTHTAYFYDAASSVRSARRGAPVRAASEVCPLAPPPCGVQSRSRTRPMRSRRAAAGPLPHARRPTPVTAVVAVVATAAAVAATPEPKPTKSPKTLAARRAASGS